MKKSAQLFALIVMFALATVAGATQKADPRIGQSESLALIGMDPVDSTYRTNYGTHKTGVLLVPSPGPIQGKKGWYTGLAVPAGTHVDVPAGATMEPFNFTDQNGVTFTAMKVTLAPGTMGIVYACGNGHNPNGPMIMKMIHPMIEVREAPAPAAPPTVQPAAPPANNNAELAAVLKAMADQQAEFQRSMLAIVQQQQTQQPQQNQQKQPQVKSRPVVFGVVGAGLGAGAGLVINNNKQRICRAVVNWARRR